MQPLTTFPNGFQIPKDLNPLSQPKEICEKLFQNPEKLAEYILCAGNDDAWRSEKENTVLLSEVTRLAADASLPHGVALRILRGTKEKFPPENPLLQQVRIKCKEGEVKVYKFALAAFSPAFSAMLNGSFRERSLEIDRSDLKQEVMEMFQKEVEEGPIDFSKLSGEMVVDFLHLLRTNDPKGEIIKNAHARLISKGQIRQNNVLDLLFYSYEFDVSEMTNSCFAFLETAFPHVKFSTSYEQFYKWQQPRTAWDYAVVEDGKPKFIGKIQLRMDIPSEELLELNPVLEHLKKIGPARAPEKWYWSTCSNEEGYSRKHPLIQELMDKGKAFKAIKYYYSNEVSLFKFDDRSIFALSKFIKTDLTLFINPLNQKSLQKNRTDWKSRMILEYVHRFDTSEELIDILTSEYELVQGLKFSLRKAPHVIFRRQIHPERILIELRGWADAEYLHLKPLLEVLQKASLKGVWGVQVDLLNALNKPGSIQDCANQGNLFQVACAAWKKKHQNFFLSSPFNRDLISAMDFENLNDLETLLEHFLFLKTAPLSQENVLEWQKCWGMEMIKGYVHTANENALVDLLTSDDKGLQNLKISLEESPAIIFERIGPHEISINLNRVTDRECIQLIPLIESLWRECQEKGLKVALSRKKLELVEEKTYVDRLWGMKRDGEGQQGEVSLDLFLTFLKEDLPLMLQPLNAESARLVLRSISNDLWERSNGFKEVLESCGDILKEEFLQVYVPHYGENAFNPWTILDISSFFDGNDLEVLKDLAPLLTRIKTLNCRGARSLKPEQLLHLARLCPNVTTIDLTYCEQFKGKHIMALKSTACLDLKNVQMSSRSILGIHASPISSKSTKVLRQLGCSVTVSKDRRSPEMKETAMREEAELKKRLEKRKG